VEEVKFQSHPAAMVLKWVVGNLLEESRKLFTRGKTAEGTEHRNQGQGCLASVPAKTSRCKKRGEKTRKESVSEVSRAMPKFAYSRRNEKVVRKKEQFNVKIKGRSHGARRFLKLKHRRIRGLCT